MKWKGMLVTALIILGVIAIATRVPALRRIVFNS